MNSYCILLVINIYSNDKLLRSVIFELKEKS